MLVFVDLLVGWVTQELPLLANYKLTQDPECCAPSFSKSRGWSRKIAQLINDFNDPGGWAWRAGLRATLRMRGGMSYPGECGGVNSRRVKAGDLASSKAFVPGTMRDRGCFASGRDAGEQSVHPCLQGITASLAVPRRLLNHALFRHREQQVIQRPERQYPGGDEAEREAEA